MPEVWQVSIAPTREKLIEAGIDVDEAGWLPSVTGVGATPEAARADARRRLGAWMEVLSALEEAERT